MAGSCCSCGGGFRYRLPLAMDDSLLIVRFSSLVVGHCSVRHGSSGPVPVQLRIVIAPGERDDVDGCADPGSFENVRVSVDFAQIDRDVAREADDVAG